MTAPSCRTCAAAVRRVRDADLGITAAVEPVAIPETAPIDASRVVYEHHPRVGWGVTGTPQQRGYPLHYLHTCSR